MPDDRLLPSHHPLAILARDRAVRRIAVVGAAMVRGLASLVGWGVPGGEPAVAVLVPPVALDVIHPRRLAVRAAIGRHQGRRPVVDIRAVGDADLLDPAEVRGWPSVVAAIDDVAGFDVVAPDAVVVTAVDGVHPDLLARIGSWSGQPGLFASTTAGSTVWRGLGCSGAVVRRASIEPFLWMVNPHAWWLMAVDADEIATWRHLKRLTGDADRTWDVVATVWPHGTGAKRAVSATARVVAAVVDKGWSARVLAKRLGHANNGLVSRVLAGTKPIPLDAATAWAVALGFGPSETDAFFTEVALDHTPARIRSSWTRMRADLLALGRTA